ncbi:MAG TPA: hypothetical protein VJJ21_05345 [Candidatus Nanoarchaeia archaeon]|nr:hypothetical protein [Candidatus Nanoarchaeia archaeon]
MKQLRNLVGIVALSAMGIAGCSNKSTSSYRIDGADVTLDKSSRLFGFSKDAYLNVVRGDTSITYTDWFSNGRLNSVEINPNKTEFQRYVDGRGEIDDAVLAKAQEQFIGYLGRIAEIDKQRKEQEKQDALNLLGK